MQVLKGANGDYSSKRTAGFIYMMVALIMAIVDQLTKFDISNFEVWFTIVVTGATLLGVSLIEYFSKIDVSKGKKAQQ